jgi:outer membrane lipoprotein-sorting protein
MKPIAFATLSIAAVLGLAPVAHAETAAEIVAAADKVRNPGKPFRSTSTLTEYVSGKPKNQNVVVVLAKEDPATHQFRNLIRFAQPARDAGKMVLLDTHAFWFYDPASKASVRISPQQRLTGQASIADVLNVNLAMDYTAATTGQETIQDADHKDRVCDHLDLTASNPLASYNHIEYWVERGTHYPIKAKFYSDSGRLLKILYYRGFHEVLGGVRPGEAVLIDAVSSTLVTTVTYGDMAFQDIPDAWFQRDYLPRLQAK